MKKVKITVNGESLGRTLYVFADPAGAYTWLTEAHGNPGIIDSIPDVDHVALMPGEFIEAEWRGCVFAYDVDNTHVRIDYVRFAKVQHPKNASGMLISAHFGWTVPCIIPFYQYSDNDITVCTLKAEDQKIDLIRLFKDEMTV